MATKTTNKTIWTVALVGVLIYFVWKILPGLLKKGGSSSLGGGAGAGGGDNIAAPNYAAPQYPSGGGGGGGALGSGALGPANLRSGGSANPLTLAQALESGNQDVLNQFGAATTAYLINNNEGLDGFGFSRTDSSSPGYIQDTSGTGISDALDGYQIAEQPLTSFDLNSLAVPVPPASPTSDASPDAQSAGAGGFLGALDSLLGTSLSGTSDSGSTGLDVTNLSSADSLPAYDLANGASDGGVSIDGNYATEGSSAYDTSGYSDNTGQGYDNGGDPSGDSSGGDTSGTSGDPSGDSGGDGGGGDYGNPGDGSTQPGTDPGAGDYGPGS